MTMFRTVFTLIACAILLARGAECLAAKPDAADYTVPYQALLAAYVHPGEKDGVYGALVDYKGWAADANHAEAVKLLKQVKPDQLTGKALTAFWINAYNLLAIDLIVQHQEKESIRNVGSVLDNPWNTFTWEISGRSMKLADIEHELHMHSDPRLHMALCNTSLSAPDLRDEPYSAATLDTQLDGQAWRFLDNEQKGLKIRGSVLEVSKLFQQFAHDFENKGGTVKFLRQYHPVTPANGVVQGFFEPNWQLNGSWGAEPSVEG